MIKLGSIVKVIVDHPDGVVNDITNGEIGVIITIIDNVDYEMHNHYGDYWYGADQIMELTDEECKEALRKELMR